MEPLQDLYQPLQDLYQRYLLEQGQTGLSVAFVKQYITRGTYILPPAPSLRIITDTFAYCAGELPNVNTISISGYHLGEAGATPVQEIAFTLAKGIAYVQAAIDAARRM